MISGRSGLIFALSLLFWLGAVALALRIGAVPDASFDLILQLRVPRIILASAVGIGLAVAGATLQALFANPLCEPYTLGISSGSALGAVIGISLGLEATVAGLSAPAFGGAIAFVAVLSLLSLRRGVGNVALLLAGVMLGFLGSSLVALWMAMADPNGIQSAIYWLLGDFSRARTEGALLALVSITISALILWSRWRDLDALLMGEEGAASLGVEVAKARRWVILLSSIMVGICVSGAGMIGFVGLIVPHLARRWVGPLHRMLIPLTAIWGAAVLTLADALARVLMRPFELPVGVVTALVGAPLFIWMMLQRRETE